MNSATDLLGVFGVKCIHVQPSVGSVLRPPWPSVSPSIVTCQKDLALQAAMCEPNRGLVCKGRCSHSGGLSLRSVLMSVSPTALPPRCCFCIPLPLELCALLHLALHESQRSDGTLKKPPSFPPRVRSSDSVLRIV